MRATTNPPPAPGAQRPQRTLRVLSGLGRRLRRLLVGVAALHAGNLVVAAALASFFLDYTLELPLEVRAVLLAGAVVGGGIGLLRLLVPPLRGRFTAEELALLVEEANPDLRQALITAVELTDPRSEGARHVSRDLVAAVVRDVERTVERVDLRRIGRRGPLWRRALLLGCLCSAFGFLAVSHADLMGVWFSRSVLLGTERWPKSTRLELDPSMPPLVVAPGDRLPVIVRLVRGQPRTVTVEWTVGGRTARSQSMQAYGKKSWDVELVDLGPEPERVESAVAAAVAQKGDGAKRLAQESVSRGVGLVAAGLFEEEARSLEAKLQETGARVLCRGFDTFECKSPTFDEDFTFVVTGGDDRLGPLEVQVFLRPMVDMASIELALTYPEYTGLGPSSGEGDAPEEPAARFSQRHGDLSVPVGTEVAYRMAATVPIRSAFLVLEEEPEESANAAGGGISPAALPQPGDPPPAAGGTWPADGAEAAELEEDARHFHGRFRVVRSGQYFFQLEAESGFRSVASQPFSIRAIPDRKPRVRITRPDRFTEEVSPEAKIPVRIEIEDDYGIRDGAIDGDYLPAEGDERVSQSIPLPSVAADSPRSAGARHEVELELEVAELETGTGERPRPGARFEFLARAADFGETPQRREDGTPRGNVGESQIHRLQVVSRETLERLLADQLLVVRDHLRDLLNHQISARKDLREFQQSTLLGGEIPVSEAHKLSRYRQDQHRITEGIDRQEDEISRILARMDANVVGDEAWRSWIRGIRGDVRDISLRKSSVVEKDLDGLRERVREAAQASRLLAPILALQREAERDLRTVVMRLSEFGDKNALIQLLRDLRRRQEELRDRTRDQLSGNGPPAGS